MTAAGRIGIVLLILGLLLVLGGVLAKIQHWSWTGRAMGLGMLLEMAGIILLLRGQRKSTPGNQF